MWHMQYCTPTTAPDELQLHTHMHPPRQQPWLCLRQPITEYAWPRMCLCICQCMHVVDISVFRGLTTPACETSKPQSVANIHAHVCSSRIHSPYCMNVCTQTLNMSYRAGSSSHVNEISREMVISQVSRGRADVATRHLERLTGISRGNVYTVSWRVHDDSVCNAHKRSVTVAWRKCWFTSTFHTRSP